MYGGAEEMKFRLFPYESNIECGALRYDFSDYGSGIARFA